MRSFGPDSLSASCDRLAAGTAPSQGSKDRDLTAVLSISSQQVYASVLVARQQLHRLLVALESKGVEMGKGPGWNKARWQQKVGTERYVA